MKKMPNRLRRLRQAVEALELRRLLAGSVVINEIHYNPSNATENVEFIELHNPGDAAVDLSGAAFTNGVSYTFPASTSLPADGYLVIAENPSAAQSKFGITGVLGPWTGKLSNSGETITLKSAANVLLDEVDYQLGFPWPTVGDAPGRSIELINPLLDNGVGGNWRSGIPTSNTQLFGSASSWRYRKGTSEASSPTSSWRNLSFVEDGTWATGAGPVGYDSSLTMGTNLADMNGGYTSVFMRKTFTVANPALYSGLRLEALYDDGFNVWINGTLAKSQNVSGSNLAYNATASVTRENGNYDAFNLSNLLVSGTNIIAVQFFNIGLSTSSDAFFDARLFGTNGGVGGPTPGAINSNFAANAAPAMRQLTQTPQQPLAGQDVTITMKVTDPDNVASVNLEYQLVNPGSYIRLTDSTYATSWTTLAMHDDGLNGDALAFDGIYSVILPASLQTNRRLVRYRVTATDGLGASVRVPYLDDGSPNFAYFVYNGVPSWTGADNPGVSPVQTFPTTITATGPAVYQIIANATDINNSQYVSSSDGVDFPGTMVYDSIVYDHITFSNRGEVSTYVSGKNKWKLSFNTGHYFQARDNYGHKYDQAWGKMNLNANASPWISANRGMAGLDETVSYRLYQLAGVLAPNTNYVHLRVIDDAQEAPADQYGGDLWGLYLAVENEGTQFIAERNLPDGNTYAISGGAGELKNQAANQPSDGSDWNTFKASASVAATAESWWNTNLNLDSFFSFTAINRADGNVDLRVGDNYMMYHSPDGLWQPMPWDLDMMYIPETHQAGFTYLSNSLVYSNIALGYRNRAREIQDLLFSNASITGGQVAQLINEYARFVNTPNGAGGWNTGWAELDQYMWNHNPHTAASHLGAFYQTPRNQTMKGGTYTRTLATPDFAGMIKYVTDYMTNTDPDSWTLGDGDQRGYGFNYLRSEATDVNIPNTPTTTYIGGANFPINNLKFSTSAYSDPDSSPFASMEWRIGEISNPNTPNFDPTHPWIYEITPTWESGEITTFGSQITIPSTAVLPGHTYRLRVRFKDDTGRWSHWSDATVAGQSEFVVSAVIGPLVNNLRVTELNYNPAAFAGVTDPQDMEFIELTNYSASTLNLNGTYFSNGITFTFGGVSLAAGQSGVVVRSQSGFQTRYGNSALILGTYGASATNFSNGSEQVTIMDTLGSAIADFTYADTWYPTTDGGGYTLEVVNPASNPNLNLPASWRASPVTGGTPGVNDHTSPVVNSANVDLATSPVKLNFLFSENVSASIGLVDVSVQNQTTLASYNPTGFSYSAGTNTLTFTFAPGALPNGNYHATLLAVGVTDPSGNPITADYPFDFFSLAGDANHDRYVNSADQAILTANLNQSGKNFSQGDFDYGGTVNSADQTILNNNFHIFLPAQGAYSIPTTSAADTIKLIRENATYFDLFVGADVTATYRVPFGAASSSTFAGGNGNDALTIDFTNGTPFSGVGMSIDGQGNTDTLAVVGTSGADSANFSSTSVTLGAVTLTTSNVETRTFDGKLGGDTLTVGTGVTLALPATQVLATLTVNAGAAVNLNQNGNIVLDVTTLSLNATGKIDIANNAMILRTAGALSSITSKILSGQNGFDNINGQANWNGNGILSSTARTLNVGLAVDLYGIGAIRNADLDDLNGLGSRYTVWKGRTVAAEDVLIRFTYLGDADMNGTVTIDDYNLIDGAVLGLLPNKGWASGNFDYTNSTITIDDYNAIDTGYLYEGASLGV